MLLGAGRVHQDAQVVVHCNAPARCLGKVQRRRELGGTHASAPGRKLLISAIAPAGLLLPAICQPQLRRLPMQRALMDERDQCRCGA